MTVKDNKASYSQEPPIDQSKKELKPLKKTIEVNFDKKTI